MQIRTYYQNKEIIPLNERWIAHDPNEDGEGWYGHGETEEIAIEYYLENIIMERPKEVVHHINNHAPLIEALKTCISWFTDNQDCSFPIDDYTKAVETYISATTTP